jgi:hypothetical protein
VPGETTYVISYTERELEKLVGDRLLPVDRLAVLVDDRQHLGRQVDPLRESGKGADDAPVLVGLREVGHDRLHDGEPRRAVVGLRERVVRVEERELEVGGVCAY